MPRSSGTKTKLLRIWTRNCTLSILTELSCTMLQNWCRLASGFAERTARMWAKKPKEDKDWNVLRENKANRRKDQLKEKHKIHLLHFYDVHPQAGYLWIPPPLLDSYRENNCLFLPTSHRVGWDSMIIFYSQDCSCTFSKRRLVWQDRDNIVISFLWF